MGMEENSQQPSWWKEQYKEYRGQKGIFWPIVSIAVGAVFVLKIFGVVFLHIWDVILAILFIGWGINAISKRRGTRK